ncbi:hypothetical protein BJ998_000865 [Kutzneria kofuensis]|uniref:Uncharacterized protein n=1 Tax=Kutzneria kofuensis TaxID=103725 RepID=A0A7W9KD92_9PSEU|nr:hypothetical protein [Kutzneria kofuensis]
MGTQCLGCGEALSAGASRGRPARYHGPTCRQRARRARLAVINSEVLDAVAVVESTISEVRRAVLAGESPGEAGHQLVRAAAELAERLGLSGAGSPADPSADRPVTKSVTLPSDQTEPSMTAPAVTKSVTKRVRPPRRPHVRSAVPALLDLDTVRQERSTDPLRPGWRVVAGAADAPVLVGFLEPTYSATGRRSSRWEARTDRLTLVSGGPWPNRATALANLVAVYQRVAKHMSDG